MSKKIPDRNSKLLSEENVRLNILPSYGLTNCNIEQIKFKDSLKQRAVYKVSESSTKKYCLKKVYYGIGELLFTYSAVEWWNKKGVNVPIFIPTASGGRFISYENMLFILTPWIHGSKLDYDNLDSFIETGNNLAYMHKVGQNFKPINGSTLKMQNSNPFKSITKRHLTLINYYNSALNLEDTFSKFYIKYFDKILQLSFMAYKISSTINYSNLTTSLCHMDYVNKNILFDNNNKVWVIDFDNCKITPVGNDICHSLRRYLKRSSTLWNFDTARLWLEIYNRTNPLNHDDFKFIYMSLVFPQKIWKLTRDYYKNYRKCNKNAFAHLLEQSLATIDTKITFALDFELELDHLVSAFKNSPKFFIDLSN
ncbi:CotS family spore coat protein [Oceanirhabdus sp. W0125-5]|uniref:CotS family spore coat protein n=1 Tax=Oceanirhabdus sp. W0125-5 TaxID=2999116 RepID=UPI0022F2B9DD|nr:CotS family spore coat protein [Oceanirhabdus sp. W0125-5]WBW95761.1 CotS family spore coat protein [Oceanirhabdus sp. W0125-5]